MPNLSKSKLLAFRQCPKRLWLEVHRPDLRNDSDSTNARFAVGYQVGEAARRIYDPSGDGVTIDVEADGFEFAFTRSQELIAAAKQPIFEAGFQIEGALAFADVMLPIRRVGQTVWHMIEVKSSTSIKDYHHDDIAIQAYVARASGVNLASVSLAHIDNSFTYPGGGDYRGLLKENDLTAEVFDRAEEVKTWIHQAHDIVSRPTAPEIPIGPHCYTPFECGFCGHCSPPTPQAEFPIAWLPNFRGTKRKKLEDQGIDSLRDVPDHMLNDKQRRVKTHTLTNKAFFDAAGAASDLAGYGFPAYFLDFETVQFAVPLWAGTRPYQQIVFQFSLHIFTENRDLEHLEFLDPSGNDPSNALIEKLISDCGNSGPIFVYNAGFEKGRIKELAMRYPHYESLLIAISKRIVDLLPIARDRYYHPSQEGSWSIKKVLPAIAPELHYDTLDGVQDGDSAMDAFVEAINPITPKERKETIERQLLAYCCLDTFGMVKLWQFFCGNASPVR